MDQFGIRSEVFKRQIYAPLLSRARQPSSIIDVGCNSGWFVLWLAWRLGRRDLTGLLIEADPRLVDEARWHVQVNGLRRCDVVHGAVGAAREPDSVPFFLSASASQSSLKPPEAGFGLPQKGPVRRIEVPAVSVAEAWRRLHGDAEVDLMKIDIEGTELAFLRNDGDLIRDAVKTVVIEWHKWGSSRSELDDAMSSLRFRPCDSFEEDPRSAVIVYEKP